MKATLKQGFTMIELLVVIVILGILAGSLFGPVQSFLLKGKLTGAMGQGRKVVQAIAAADMSGRYAGMAWPVSQMEGGAAEGTTGSAPNMEQVFGDTPKYFTEALYMRETSVTKRNRLKVLQEIEPSMLVAEGSTSATGQQIEARNCAWMIATDVHVMPSIAPVFVTKNVKRSAIVAAAGNDTAQGPEELLETYKPFGQDGCVMIYKDGSGKIFTAQDVYPQALLEGIGSDTLTKLATDQDAKFEFLACPER